MVIQQDLHQVCELRMRQLQWTPSLNTQGGTPIPWLPNPYVTGTCNANISKYYDLVPLQ